MVLCSFLTHCRLKKNAVNLKNIFYIRKPDKPFCSIYFLVHIILPIKSDHKKCNRVVEQRFWRQSLYNVLLCFKRGEGGRDIKKSSTDLIYSLLYLFIWSLYFLGWYSIKLGGTYSSYKFGNIIDQGLKVNGGVFFVRVRVASRKKVLLWKSFTELAVFKMSCIGRARVAQSPWLLRNSVKIM